jgi:hypothetical protein
MAASIPAIVANRLLPRPITNRPFLSRSSISIVHTRFLTPSPRLRHSSRPRLSLDTTGPSGPNGPSNGGGGGGDGGGDGGNGDDEREDDGDSNERNRAGAMLVLVEVGRGLESLPSDLAAAIKAGRIPGDIVKRFLELEKSPLLGWLLQFGGFKERLLADDLFMTKVAIECGVGIFTKVNL